MTNDTFSATEPTETTAPVVLVTGASRGIGLAIVQAYAAAGWRTAGCARQPGAGLAAAAELAVTCDVTDATAVRTCVAGVHAHFGRLDALVCNAGLAGSNPFVPDDDDALWRAILATNLDGTWYACRAALPLLPERRGRIINIASVLALCGVPDQPAYCAAKHGVLGLTRSLALHAAARGITVNAICPGWTRTAMAEARYAELGIDAATAAAGVPLGRIVEPEEVAALALWLASPAAGAITGQALSIDGGALV